MPRFLALVLENVKRFMERLPVEDQGKISGAITVMAEGVFEPLYIKTLKSPLKELLVKNYRVVFFIHQNTIYYIKIFIKKTAKTPKNEIENAWKIYKMIIANDK